ncbi:MAG: hypothetical protein HYV15_06855, partial [Elusimicrobia bacterium]|nr:hypothetical protein [Elusimicrobiota bacterium]
MRRNILVLAFLAAFPAALPAQGFKPMATAPVDSVPNGMNYQGRLEKDGFPVSGDKVMIFRLFDAATGGNKTYDSGNVTVSVVQGLFAVSLDIPFTALTGTSQKYIEIDVEGITLSPRDPIRSVPYAKVAETVEGTIDVTNSGLTFTTPIGDALAISSVSGRVGIGTNLPVARLTVSSGSGETGNIFVVSTGAVTLASIDGNGRVSANSYVGDGTTLTGIVRKAGDGMTGPLTVNASSLTVHGAADFGSIGTKSSFGSGGVLTMAAGANIILSGVGRITGLPSPASTSESATKQYVDTVVVSSTGWTATP